MYIMINNVIGEKTIYLSYPIQNFDSSKEVAVIIMLSNNVQYKKVKTHIIDYVPPGNEKRSLSGPYAGRELISILGGMIELTQFENDERVIKTNKLRGITEMVLNLNELDNTDNLKDGRPSNALLAYHVTANEDFIRFEPLTPQYKKLKNGEFVSLALRITDQKNNIITDGPQATVVLHICDCKSQFPLKMEYGTKLNPRRSLRTSHGMKGTRQK